MKFKIITALLCTMLISESALCSENPVTIKAVDCPVRDVLSSISALHNKNIIIDDSVKGNITLDITNLNFDKALNFIASVGGLSYKQTPNAILITSAEKNLIGSSDVTVFKLNYSNAKEIKEALSPIIGKNSKITTEPIGNTIIFCGTSGDEAKIRNAIRHLDIPSQQVTLEAKIIALNKEASKKLGIAWQWDQVPQNTELNNSDDEDFGGIIRLGSDYQFRFTSTLNALFSKGKAKLLATPRIITVPGKTAGIFIGDHIPVVTEKLKDGVTVTSTEFVDAGIQLEYTPIVSEDGIITSVVHTEVSTPTLISELKNYKITSRTADTHVRMRNGETLVIGGLINEEEQKVMQQIPLLSKIPILGELFKSRSKTKANTEVIMLLTPHLTEAGASPAIYNPKIIEEATKGANEQ